MYREKPPTQTSLEFVSIEQLVPANHPLRIINKYIDFRNLAIRLKPFYCENNGRPCLDPLLLLKMIFIGYCYGIPSERRLSQEIQVNVAYRWFLGLSLTEPVPHHSTISQNRRRRFTESPVFREVFEDVVKLAQGHRMIDGRMCFGDSTQVKANANKNKYEHQEVQVTPLGYLEALEAGVQEERKDRGKKPLPPKKDGKPETKVVRLSTTDPESGYVARDEKQGNFTWGVHQITDGKHNIIVDVHVENGAVHDSIPILNRVQKVNDLLGCTIGALALDSAYLTAPVCKGLLEQTEFPVIAHRRFKSKSGLIPKAKFTYDSENGTYFCPEGYELVYATTTREGYNTFVSDPEICKECPRLKECTQSKNCRKTVTRHIWEDAKEKVRANRLTKEGKIVYKLRPCTIERSFADGKQRHGLRYARMRGKAKMEEQALNTATCQNLIKLAYFLWRKDGMPTLA